MAACGATVLVSRRPFKFHWGGLQSVVATICRNFVNWCTFLGSAHQVILRPQVLQVTLLRINPMSFRNWLPISMSMKSYVRNNLFPSLSFPIEVRLKDVLGTTGIAIRRCWYFDITLLTFPLENYTMQHNTKQPDKLPQQRIPHWPLNATACVGVGRKARKTWGLCCTIKDLLQSSGHRSFIK